MTVDIGKNKNTNDVAEVNSGVDLNASTTIIIAAENLKRTVFHVNTDSANSASWVKLQPADVDDDKKGIFLDKSVFSSNRWDMPPDNIYTGEISAIADSGTPTIYVTEY